VDNRVNESDYSSIDLQFTNSHFSIDIDSPVIKIFSSCCTCAQQTTEEEVAFAVHPSSTVDKCYVLLSQLNRGGKESNCDHG
jgi:hypothetical protein